MNADIQNEVNRVLLVVKRIEEKQVDLTVKYDNWVKVCFALCDLIRLGKQKQATDEEQADLKETAWLCFKRVSALNPGYDEADCLAKFENCAVNADGSIKLGTFYQLAADNGVTWQFRGRPKGSVKVREPQERKPTKMEIVGQYLEGKNIRYDVITRKLQHRKTNEQGELGAWVEMKDRDINDHLYQCNLECGENITPQQFRSVLFSSKIPEVHPLREYLEQLPQWDQEQPDFLGQVANMVHIKKPDDYLGEMDLQELWVAVFKKWFVAMLAGWKFDDVVNHQVLVLIGEQGKYKTTWLDRLLPSELKAYRCKQTAMENMDKDEQMRAVEYGLINLDEMDKLSERGLNAIKSLFTNTEIDQRAPYAYGKEKRIRIASYVASGNKEQFLTDATGNRRWLPFTVEDIDSPYEHEFPYQGMYAQGVYLLEHGFNYWISAQETADMSEHVDNYMVPMAEADLVSVYFEPVEKGAVDAVALTLPEIRAKLVSWGNLKHIIGLPQLGTIMNSKGFKKIRLEKNGPRRYLIREKDANYINAQRRQMAT